MLQKRAEHYVSLTVILQLEIVKSEVLNPLHCYIVDLPFGVYHLVFRL